MEPAVGIGRENTPVEEDDGRSDEEARGGVVERDTKEALCQAVSELYIVDDV